MHNRFVILTWLLILPLHIVFIDLLLAFNTSGHGISSIVIKALEVDTLLYIGLFTLVFSIPGAVILAMLVWVAKEFIYNRTSQFVFIYAAAAGCTILCYLLLEYILGPGIHVLDLMPFAAVSIATVFISVFLTRKYYYSYFNAIS